MDYDPPPMTAVSTDLTDSSSHSLLAAHDFLCRLIDRSQVGVIAWQNDRCVLVNDAMLNLCQCSADQLESQQQFVALIHQPQQAQLKQRRHGCYRLQYRLRLANGSYRAVCEWGMQHGEHHQSYIVAIDHWLKLEQQYQYLEQTLRALMVLMPTPLIEIDTQHDRIITSNQAAETFFNQTTLTHCSLTDLLPAQQALSIQHDCRKALKTTGNHNLTTMVLDTNDGKRHFIQGACRTISNQADNEDQTTQHRVVIWFHDYTAEHCQVQNRQIRQLSDQFCQDITSTLLAKRFDPAVASALKNLGLFLNTSGTALYWPEQNTWQQQHVALIDTDQTPPETLDLPATWQDGPTQFAVPQHIPGYFKAIPAHSLAFCPIQQQNGPAGLLIIWQQQSRAWSRDEQRCLNQISNALALAQERQRLALANEQATQQAMDQARAKAKQFNELSHQLSIPLASLLGSIDRDQSTTSMIPSVKVHSERLLALLHHQEVLKQFDASNLFLQEQLITPDEIITTCVDLCQQYLGPDHHIEVRHTTTTTTLLLDPDKLKQLIQHLISWSLRSGCQTVVLQTQFRQGLWSVSTPLTERSVQFNSHRRLVEALSQALNGEFYIEPERAIVRIKIPETAHNITATDIHQTRQGTAAQADALVLIVEDDATSREYLKLILNHLHYRCLIATDGQQALELLQQRQQQGIELPQIILMDCQMPIMDGFACTKAIRQSDEPLNSIPIVALTAHSLESDRQRCLAAGMNDYLRKPVNRKDFKRMIKRVLTTV